LVIDFSPSLVDGLESKEALKLDTRRHPWRKE
jgi:hypothetical protein